MAVRLRLLSAGWTTHPAGVARRGAGWAPLVFPALVAVVEHPTGVVLFDTGYAPRVQRAVSRGIDRVYGRLLPVHVTPEETAVEQLAALGVAAQDVRTVVLSHLHADHVGGLLDFPAAQVVTDPAVVARARSARGLGRLRRGWLPALLPDDLPDRVVAPGSLPRAELVDLDPLVDGRDLLGDGSLVVVPLPGHSADHLGLLVRTGVRDVLLVGDAAWDQAAMTRGELPHPVARAVMADWARYRTTIDHLGRLATRRPDLLVLPSHDQQAIRAAQALLSEPPAADA